MIDLRVTIADARVPHPPDLLVDDRPSPRSRGPVPLVVNYEVP